MAKLFPTLALPRSGLVDSKKNPLSQVHLAPKNMIIIFLSKYNLKKRHNYSHLVRYL